VVVLVLYIIDVHYYSPIKLW